jgi:hypothetical protein
MKAAPSHGRSGWVLRCAWILLVAAGLIAPGAGAGPVVPPPTRGDQPVGDQASHPSLLEIDAEVRRHGVDRRYKRRVEYVEALYAVVDYSLPPHSEELKHGVQVWVHRESGKRFIVRKSVLRAAHREVVRRGWDLSRYTWVVERIRHRFLVTFNRRPPGPDIAVLGGSITITVDGRTGRVVDLLLHQ